MIPIPSHVGSVVVDEDDEFRNDENNERGNTQQVNDQT